jgi:hypothetical protein
MSVKIVRLITGEDLLCKVLPSATEVVRMENPVRVVIIPEDPRSQYDPKRAPRIGLAPYAEFSSDKEFTIAKSHVVCIMEPVKEFAAQYTSMFSGIIMNPNGPGLILPGA